MPLKTPDWIKEGFDSKSDWEKAQGKNPSKKKGKTFKIRRCPNCKSENVKVIVEKETKGDWECKECNWQGQNPEIKELNEDEFLEHLEKQEGAE